MRLHYVGEFFDADKILSNLDELMLDTDTDISALVHDFILKIEAQRRPLKSDKEPDPGITLGQHKNPFANIDIRSCFKELEQKILEKYYDNGVERRGFF